MTLDTNSTGTLNISSSVVCSKTTDSSSSITGGTVISGGCGISKKLYVGDAIVGASSLTCGSIVSSGAISGTTITGTGALTVSANSITCGAINNSGIMTSTNATDSTSYSTGSVIISGGVGISKHMYLNGGLYLSTTGGTAGQLDYYETTTSFVMRFETHGSGGTTVDATTQLARIGNITTMTLWGFVMDSNGDWIQSNSAFYLPARFRPTTAIDVVCHTINLGTWLDTGVFNISANGFCSLKKSYSSIYFSVGSGSGLAGTLTCTYLN